MLVAALSVASVVAIYLWPRAGNPSVPKSEVVIVLAVPLASISSGDAVRFDAPAGTEFTSNASGTNTAVRTTKTGWLVGTSSGLVAFDATSLDDGCTVYFDPSAHEFESPCHGSIYALDGAVLRGPAVAPLAHLGFRELDASRIAVEGTLA